nr:PREDICTED: F-box only protein 34 isoform X2 [Latimeria chalumnae]XP_005986527.1 PREDICTED: F-box only protein 34 isoform X2 [Latimeria chalumnae]XP_014341140.1 PREDICTED: F-box only protein 34 isoform X2 [Latimeria chalumnae]XP_014341148.1 PREDICTED: F-box only protein 34 isoform X2 [Latimeria chalumnae]|eukprot:XP_005986526.1 PREDICTED: F-box only protein 34 isoform X2 [Latimeria chalumnae]
MHTVEKMLQKSKKAFAMHLKPYPKFQTKDSSQESTSDTQKGLLPSQQMSIRGERYKHNSDRQTCSAAAPVSYLSSCRPFRTPSQDTMCNMSVKNSTESPVVKGRMTLCPSVSSMTIHQGEEGEGSLDIWAVIKPGNTKEKIAFFAARQCTNSRTGSMKMKGSWEIDGTVAKRRRKSTELEKTKYHPVRTKEYGNMADKKGFPPEPLLCSAEDHFSVNGSNESVDEICPGRSLSVIEMVAFLEQRANAVLTDCTKNCTNSLASARVIGQSKGTPSMLECVLVSSTSDANSGKGTLENSEHQSECVRVLEMVAKLESECLKRQSEREAGSLSRNNSFRRNVGRVLLANGVQHKQNSKGTEVEKRLETPGLDQCLPTTDSNIQGTSCSLSVCTVSWQRTGPGTSQEIETSTASSEVHSAGVSVPTAKVLKNINSCNVGMLAVPCDIHSPTYQNAGCEFVLNLLQKECVSECEIKEHVECTNENAIERLNKDSVCISISVTEPTQESLTDKSNLSLHKEPPPGMLFFLHRNLQIEQKTDLDESRNDVVQGVAQGKQARLAERKKCEKSRLLVNQCSSSPPTESASQVLEVFPLKRQVSHEFLEARFKIQQLLEPQQYMHCLPHHILVKIFKFLPTKTLAALKCTCHYFKLIIENYDIRPADSRWVCDPRYKDDPCKHCKRKYTKGDVSLCRWHPKPYCQALPYGPGYWMCCHNTQKDTPGCKVGLHDNHWVPACHSLNMSICKKAKELEDDDF